MKIVVMFNDGNKLEVPCEKVDIWTSPIDGKLTKLQFFNVKDNIPLYIDADKVNCVYQTAE